MTSKRPTAPNIILIVSDDQGPWALGAAGNTEIRTPVIDALAADGVRLSRFFCASPVCSPARASLLTARVPSQHGVHDYLDGAHAGTESTDYLAGMPTFTEALADAGYRLGLSGKWHLGASDVPRRGFVHWFALHGGGSSYDRAVMYRDGRAESVEGYLTDIITDDAISFIDDEAAGDSPFFLTVNFTAPHKPFAGQHPDEYTAMYRDCAFESCPQESPHPWLQTLDGGPIGGEPDAREALIGYFAAVTAMDAAIGRIIESVRAHGIEGETVIVFTSDNGFNAGHHGIWGKGNGTFPINMYDESVMVPFVVTAPGRVPPGRVSDALVSAYDFAPTLLDLVGLDPAPFEGGPGRSRADLLRAVDDDRRGAEPRDVVVHNEYGPVRMIRSAERKYVHRYPFGPHEFYDLELDPGERRNLIDDTERRDEIAAMRRRLAEWFDAHVHDAGRDGSRLPVTGAGQLVPLGDDPYDAFGTPAWDGAGAHDGARDGGA